jgi:hypothetical protein
VVTERLRLERKDNQVLQLPLLQNYHTSFLVPPDASVRQRLNAARILEERCAELLLGASELCQLENDSVRLAGLGHAVSKFAETLATLSRRIRE